MEGGGEGGGEGEGAGTAQIEVLPDEILLKVLSLLFGTTLMRSAPQVCKRWRKLCPEIKNVHLDFSLGKRRFLLKCLQGGGCSWEHR